MSLGPAQPTAEGAYLGDQVRTYPASMPVRIEGTPIPDDSQGRRLELWSAGDDSSSLDDYHEIGKAFSGQVVSNIVEGGSNLGDTLERYWDNPDQLFADFSTYIDGTLDLAGERLDAYSYLYGINDNSAAFDKVLGQDLAWLSSAGDSYNEFNHAVEAGDTRAIGEMGADGAEVGAEILFAAVTRKFPSVPNSRTIVSSEMEAKILYGQRKLNGQGNPSNRLIGANSGKISNANERFAVETLSVNADATRNVKLITQFEDGNVSRIKSSTLFPENWGDADVMSAVNYTGSTAPLAT